MAIKKRASGGVKTRAVHVLRPESQAAGLREEFRPYCMRLDSESKIHAKTESGVQQVSRRSEISELMWNRWDKQLLRSSIPA